MTGTTIDFFGDRWLSGSPTYHTDLDRCQPSSALYPGARARHWRMHTYETDSLSGVMLRADTETDAPEVTYPLGVAGWARGIHRHEGRLSLPSRAPRRGAR